jgi:nucleoid DNA-binding protein
MYKNKFVDKLERLPLMETKKTSKFVLMQLSTYISDLLYRYECVIVPGFGAFLTQYRSAYIDSGKNTFHPPAKVIAFNRQLQTNDGLLANYVASVEQCSYELALQKIRNIAGSLALRLSEGETIEFGSLGSFALNSEKLLQFAPLASENFNAASFGLTSLSASEVDRAEMQQDAVGAAVPSAHPTSKTTAPYMQYAAIGLIALGLAGYGGMKWYENEVQEHNYAARKEASTLVENKIQEATFTLGNPLPALEVTLPKTRGKYHIIAGAFRMQENAEAKRDALLEKGFAAKLIGANRYGLHQVIYSSHENRLEALKALRNIKQTENQDAWLLVKELP